MDNGDPVFVSVAQTGVLVKKSKLGLCGPKLYESRTIHDAASTAQALHALFPDYVGPEGMTNAALRAFVNGALHCATTAEVTQLLNTAPERESQIREMQIATLDIIADYGDILVKVSEEDQEMYPACVYPQSLLPILKTDLARLLTTEIEATPDANIKQNLEVALALLDSFIDDESANQRNSEVKAATNLAHKILRNGPRDTET
jgi:hypothetical protein